ncbi:MAG: hypothetical protein Q9164_006513 [Protoblastenia rupestris]
MMIRLLKFKSLVLVHAGTQLFSYTLALAGLGLGVFIAVKPSYRLDKYHPVIGLVVVILLLFQPIFGRIHHLINVREHRHSLWGTIHVWFGRVVITLGIINGGLGLRFADNTRSGEIAYGVVASIVWIAWMSVAVWSQLKTNKRTEDTREKSLPSPPPKWHPMQVGEEGK